MQVELKNKIITVHSLIDEGYNVKDTLNYQLIFQIGVNNALIAVFEKSTNKYIAFENFTFQNVYTPEHLAETIDSLTKESKLIKHKYKTVDIIIVNNLSTLVPNSLYEDEQKKMYLKFNTSLSGDEFVLVNELKSLDAKNIFALPFNIKSKLDYLFSNIRYHHVSSALIDSLVLQNKNQTTKKLYVHVQQLHFETIVINGKNLLFYNTFSYHSAEDFIYYLLFVCEQLELNPENIELIFLGEIERNSTIFSLTNKYIRNIKFGEHNDSAQYSYQLQTLPSHYYYTLFNTYYS